mmetsp:Transcript_676/g.1578  ORF Transcript_676/g.1578 Transcript_676/m.1578 type:complete len:115 (-) Transcript_676:1236-1580(-)
MDHDLVENVGNRSPADLQARASCNAPVCQCRRLQKPFSLNRTRLGSSSAITVKGESYAEKYAGQKRPWEGDIVLCCVVCALVFLELSLELASASDGRRWFGAELRASQSYHSAR